MPDKYTKNRYVECLRVSVSFLYLVYWAIPRAFGLDIRGFTLFLLSYHAINYININKIEVMRYLTAFLLFCASCLSYSQVARYDNEYKKNHKWYEIPLSLGELEKYLECCLCNQHSYWYFPRFTYVGNDSIFWIEQNKGVLGLEKTVYHCSALSKGMKENATFIKHFDLFKDSLNYRRPMISEDDYIMLNFIEDVAFLKRVEKVAPYGFVGKKSWNIDYRILSVTMQYTNTNKKTIKYLEMFWQTKNAVGDVRNRGSFKGTGPLKQWESGSWDWDNTSYRVAGDVKTFWVTKIVITYMDGTKKVLPEKQIIYDSRE